AYRSAPFADYIIGRAAPQPYDASLADALRETIASTREHLLDFIRLYETPPPTAMTLAQWTRPETFRSLLAAYSDHIYRHT
ncbi:siderophore-iron reductase FhuF, partial [Salmonella enterica subsp. enterica serovar Infantis]